MELARAQLEALRLEIHPHFLFNTLNSIAALIRVKDSSRALEMLLGLSELMRATVDGPRDHLVPLSTEIDFVRRYVDLQRARFADRLDIRWDVDPGGARRAGADAAAAAAGRKCHPSRHGAAVAALCA